MRALLLGILLTALALTLLPPCAIAAEFVIDDSSNAEWITKVGDWTTGTSSSAKKGASYYYCNKSPAGDKSVTFTPTLPATPSNRWEVYIWYPAGMDRTSQAEITIKHAAADPAVLKVNQQQTGGMWVYLGTYEMTPASSGNYVSISNKGVDVGKIVVADAVRFYSADGDTQPPIIMSVTCIPGSNSAIISWTTDEPSSSEVQYGKTDAYGQIGETAGPLTREHSVSITGLEALTLYHFRVVSEDGAGNIARSGDYTFKLGEADRFPPLISDIVIVPGSNSVVVMWLTDEVADSRVDYGLTAEYGSFVEKPALVTAHHVSILGLTPDTEYHLAVKSLDGARNTTISEDRKFRTLPADSVPPVITIGVPELQAESAVIRWSTNEYATSQVEYGTSISYGMMTSVDAELLIEHEVPIANLLPETTYHYRVISADGAGNTATSLDHTFRTPAVDSTPPAISTVVAVPGSRTCEITWKTDEPATTQVRYGTASPPTTLSGKDNELVTSHRVILTGLEPSTRYYYTALSCDGRGNCRERGIFSFTTEDLDVTPPEISGISVEAGSNSATISWTTDDPSTSRVEYGLDAAYGSVSPVEAAMTTHHTVRISGLTPSTTYHFRVGSTNAENLDAVSLDGTFSTNGPDVTSPEISGISFSRDMTSAVIRWRTNEPSTSQVDFGPGTEYGTTTPEDTELVTIHSVTLTGLTVNTLYHFRVRSADEAGNTAESGDYQFSTSATAPEYRMIWADSWHNGFLTPDETTEFVNTVAAANYNAIVVEVRKAADAYYMSHYEPWAANIQEGYDPLADLITKAHAAGMEVHAWIVTYRAWYASWDDPEDPDHVWNAHRDWAMANSSGHPGMDLDPGVPGVQDYIAGIVKDIVSQYNVDGINFDYVRYPGTAWGYNEYTRQRFYFEYGYFPPTSSSHPGWKEWCDYRRQQVTDLVKRCFVEAMYINPRIKLSVDTVGWEGADPNTNYEGTPQYSSVFQDARGWMSQHIVDLNILMNYKREFVDDQKQSYRRWASWLPRVANSTGRFAVDGQGIYMNSISASIEQMDFSLTGGVDGVCSYSYAVTNKDGQPASDFYGAVRGELFAAPAPIPDMPWKDEPTTGIVFGTVTNKADVDDPIYRNWLYKAAVTISGPVTRNTLTDATGTYAFLDLPPGTYTLSIGKTGFETEVFGGLSLSAGDVKRRDASLDTGMFTSPPGAIGAGWNLVSIPIEPADHDPWVVFQGLDIEGNLYKWDRYGQHIVSYTQYNPGDFGDVSLQEGYWLFSNQPAVIMYEAADMEPPTVQRIHLPRQGWSIIGCPFLSDRSWSNVQVQRGTRTVPIATAREWGWLDTICYWWDSSIPGGGLRSMGLSDDWTDTTIMKPWRGYWIQSYLDDIWLEIR